VTHDTAILALDPSTAITAAVLVTFDAAGTPTLLSHCVANGAVAMMTSHQWPAIHRAGSDTQRLWRIWETGRVLRSWALGLETAVDILAYEEPCQRGAASTAALHQAIGHYASRLLGLCVGPVRVMPIHATTAKAGMFGGAGVFRAKGQTAITLGEKGRAMLWVMEHVAGVRELFTAESGPCVPDCEAIADAVAVAVACYRAIQKPAPPVKKRPRPVKGAKQP
jgi:hypothetical protein